MHGWVVAARSSSTVCLLAFLLAYSPAFRCCAALLPIAALACAAACPAALPASSAACFIPPPPPSKRDITWCVASRQYCYSLPARPHDSLRR